MPTFTSGHALLIGVGAYQDSRWNAPITVADATGVADALRDPTVSAYPDGQVTLLTDAQATRDGVALAHFCCTDCRRMRQNVPRSFSHSQ
jgi:hypothetical protein